MKLVMNLNTCAMITQKLCTTKNLFLSTQTRDVLSHSLVCVSPHHLAYHRSGCSYENSNDHFVLSYYHQVSVKRKELTIPENGWERLSPEEGW